jgi:hypothetical protein
MTRLFVVKRASNSGSPQAVRMLGLRLQLHETDNIDHPGLQVGQVLPQDGNGSERFECRHIPGASHDHVGLVSEAVVILPPDVRGKPVGHFKDRFQSFGQCLIRAKDAKMALLRIQLRHGAQKPTEYMGISRAANPGETEY